MFTTRLAPELVIQVFDLVDPPTLVSLARTCKFLERCSRNLLRRHRDAHSRYAVITDTDSQLLLKILRTAIADPGLAWHIRDLEFLSTRTEWSHWEEGNIKEVENFGTIGPPEYAFSYGEQIALLDQLREIFRFDEQDIDIARTDLETGNDAPLKLLLFAVCPRIRSVKFTRDFHLTGRGLFEREPPQEPNDTPRSILQYFHQVIYIQLQNKSMAWPAGLDSLKDLSIGVNTGKEVGDLHFAPSHFLVTNMMQLPRLISLYCFGLQTVWEDEDPDADYKLDEGSSSVQHIFLSGVEAQRHEPVDAMISGCKELESLTIAHSDMGDVDILVGTLGEYHRSSCHTLMFYGTSGLHGYRCNMFRPESMGDLSSLRMVYVDASDVMLDAFYNYEGDVESGPDHEWIGDLDFFIEYFMNDAFSESMEVLVLGTRRGAALSQGDADFFDLAITKMIEYGRDSESDDEETEDGEHQDEGDKGDNDENEIIASAKSFEKSYPNLKAVYLGSLDTVRNTAQGRRKRWFSNAVAAGRRARVDVHTRTTRGRPLHEIDFPKPPRLSQHESTSAPAEDSLVFDVYTGQWTRSKCDNCGNCERCFEQYDISVWREV
jgi:hypothetical protein